MERFDALQGIQTRELGTIECLRHLVRETRGENMLLRADQNQRVTEMS